MGSRCSPALSKSPSGIGCYIATDLLGHFGLWEFHMTDALCRYLQGTEVPIILYEGYSVI